MTRVRELREAKGIQQKELAIDLGVTQPTISDWESGRKVPSAKSAQKLADYFGVSIDYLLGREEKETQLLMNHAKEQLSEMVRSSPSMPSGDRLLFLFDKIDFDPEIVAFNLDIDYSYVKEWFFHNVLPPRPIVDKISACVQMKPVELLNSAEFAEYSSETKMPTPVPEDGLNTERKQFSLEASNRLLVAMGFIEEGQDLSDDDLAFLTHIIGLLNSHFSKHGPGAAKNRSEGE